MSIFKCIEHFVGILSIFAAIFEKHAIASKVIKFDYSDSGFKKDFQKINLQLQLFKKRRINPNILKPKS